LFLWGYSADRGDETKSSVAGDYHFYYCSALAKSVYHYTVGKYCIIRIIASFVLAIFAGTLVEWIGRKFLKNELGKYEVCDTGCTVFTRDVFVKTILMMKKLMPYILVGGAISLSLELFNPKQLLSVFNFSNQWLSSLIMLYLWFVLEYWR
jgi:uncharacterized membrane protein YraQ (UPF0718 family)